jgi:DNA-binding NarL/FixJ family response regulator
MRVGTPEASALRPDQEIRVAVVEEHEIFRRGLIACLAEDAGLDVSHATRAEALEGQDLDLAMVSSEAAATHRFPCPIVVCSDDPHSQGRVAAGNDVVGVLHRRSLTVAQLRATVHAAAVGLRVNPQSQAERSAADPLDPRALRLLELIAEGLSTREIADAMSYSERTIKRLITGLETRMRARSRAQVVALAIRRGLI